MSSTLEQAKQLAGIGAEWTAVLKVADTLAEEADISSDTRNGYDKRLMISIILFAIWIEVAIGANLKNPQLIQQIVYLLSHPIPALHDSDTTPIIPDPVKPRIIKFVDTQWA